MMPRDHQSQHTPYWTEGVWQREGLSREVSTSGAMYSGVPTGRAAFVCRECGGCRVGRCKLHLLLLAILKLSPISSNI